MVQRLDLPYPLSLRAPNRCARGGPHQARVTATKVGGKQTTRSLSRERRKRVQQLDKDYRRFRQAQGAVRKPSLERAQLGHELEGLIREEPFKHAFYS